MLSCSPDYYKNVLVFYMFSKYFELIFYLILVIVDYNRKQYTQIANFGANSLCELIAKIQNLLLVYTKI